MWLNAVISFSNPVSSFSSLLAHSSHSSPFSSHPPGKPIRVSFLLPTRMEPSLGLARKTPTPILGYLYLTLGFKSIYYKIYCFTSFPMIDKRPFENFDIVKQNLEFWILLLFLVPIIGYLPLHIIKFTL